jgi:hypothetical protein
MGTTAGGRLVSRDVKIDRLIATPSSIAYVRAHPTDDV